MILNSQAYSLPDYRSTQPIFYDAETLIHDVCEQMSVSVSDIKSKCRKRELLLLRQVLMVVIIDNYITTLSSVAVRFNKDHATVLHSIKVMERWLSNDDEMASKYYNEVLCIVNKKLKQNKVFYPNKMRDKYIKRIDK